MPSLFSKVRNKERYSPIDNKWDDPIAFRNALIPNDFLEKVFTPPQKSKNL